MVSYSLLAELHILSTSGLAHFISGYIFCKQCSNTPFLQNGSFQCEKHETLNLNLINKLNNQFTVIFENSDITTYFEVQIKQILIGFY